jgi:predicted CxxxxCH...CXXCH cytochrome family protein
VTRPAPPALALLAVLALLACDKARELPPETEPRCQRCHGGQVESGTTNAAPPRSPGGATDRSAPGVGAHQIHLRGSAVRGPIGCDECHLVPRSDVTAGHPDGRVDVVFGTLASTSTAPAWNAGSLTCSATYCHGATLAAGGALTIPTWTATDGAASACSACHGFPPATVAGRPHPPSSACHQCHPDTVQADGTIDLAGGHHVNGLAEFASGCDGCHGAPPATGAHLAHARPPRITDMAYGQVTVLEDVYQAGDDPAPYAFGCGQCHPTDPARHIDGTVEVDLSPSGAPANTLKAANRSDAGYDPATRTCSGVACHASGQGPGTTATNQLLPVYAVTPDWRSAGPIACDACHGNPPRYPSGGPGALDANSHLQLQADGYEWGHFGGLPGPWHTSYHGITPGSLDAGPITCQACHAETVDAAATMAGGFTWLDTSGDYQLPGGFLGYACATCHGPTGTAPSGAGRVLALRHVNGRRDVVFDARPDLPAAPAMPWLPVDPDRPTRPYWVTSSGAKPPPTTVDAVASGNTISMRLTSITWDPATKTCAAAACHLNQTSVTWGADHPGFNDCNVCHQY